LVSISLTYKSEIPILLPIKSKLLSNYKAGDSKTLIAQHPERKELIEKLAEEN